LGGEFGGCGEGLKRRVWRRRRGRGRGWIGGKEGGERRESGGDFDSL